MKIINLATHPAAFISIAELVEYTGIPRRTMYHQVEKGALKAVRMGASLRIPIAEARRFVQVPAHPELEDGPLATILSASGTQSCH